MKSLLVAVGVREIEHLHITFGSVKDKAYYPNINLWTKVFFALKHLRGGVRRTATERSEMLIGLEEVPKPKVSNLDIHVSIHEKILCLK